VWEFSTPFVIVRHAMFKLKAEDTRAYLINAGFMMVGRRRRPPGGQLPPARCIIAVSGPLAVQAAAGARLEGRSACRPLGGAGRRPTARAAGRAAWGEGVTSAPRPAALHAQVSFFLSRNVWGVYASYVFWQAGAQELRSPRPGGFHPTMIYMFRTANMALNCLNIMWFGKMVTKAVEVATRGSGKRHAIARPKAE
jgi:hypothetical protein